MRERRTEEDQESRQGLEEDPQKTDRGGVRDPKPAVEGSPVLDLGDKRLAIAGVTAEFYKKNPRNNIVRPGKFLKINRAIEEVLGNLTGAPGQYLRYIVNQTLGFHVFENGKLFRLLCQPDKDMLLNLLQIDKDKSSSNLSTPKNQLINSGIVLRFVNKDKEWIGVNPSLILMKAEFCRCLAQECRHLNILADDDRFEQKSIPRFIDGPMQNLYRNFRRVTMDLRNGLASFAFKELKDDSESFKKLKGALYIFKGDALTFKSTLFNFLKCDHEGNLVFYNEHNKLRAPLLSLYDIFIRYNLYDSSISETNEQPPLSPKEEIRPKRRKIKKVIHGRIDLLESKFNDPPLKWFTGVRAKVASALDAIEWDGTDEELIKLLDKFLYETYADVERDDKFAGNVNNAVCKGDFERWLKGRQQRAKEEREAEEAAEKRREEERPLLEAEERRKEQEKEKREREREESFRREGPGCWHRHGQTIISFIRYADDCEGCRYAEPCERGEQWTEELFNRHPKGRSFTVG